jgi:PAS domain S-box-containing protein
MVPLLFWAVNEFQMVNKKNILLDNIQSLISEKILLRDEYLQVSQSSYLKTLWKNKTDQLILVIDEYGKMNTTVGNMQTFNDLLTNAADTQTIFLRVIINREKKHLNKKEYLIGLELERRLLAQLLNKTYLLADGVQQLHTINLLQLERSRNRIIVLFVILFIGLASTNLITSLVLNRTLRKRIESLYASTIRMSQGDFDFRINLSGNDELSELSQTFNEMASKLKDSYEELSQEIEERKQAEESLLESEKALQDISAYTRELIETNLDSMVTISPLGKITDVNKETEKVTGVSRDKLIGSDYSNYFVDPNLANYGYQKAFSNGLIRDYPLAIKSRNGTIIEVIFNASVYRNSSGEVVGVLATVRDVTRFNAAEKILRQNEAQIEILNQQLQQQISKLQEANRELESFSYSVSHDLRAPLRHVLGFVDKLVKLEQGNLSEKSTHCLEVIASSASRMGTLIDDLLLFSRMGRVEIMRENVNLMQLVQQVIDEITATRPDDTIIDWQIKPLPDVMADRSMLRQVLVNLFYNATKFSQKESQPQIEIGCSLTNSKENVYYVKDNGVGFDMKYIDKLFTLFQRLHSSEEFEGTGVGLANVKRIIHRHGGRVWAHGLLNEGATFFFALPNHQKGEIYEEL